VHFLCALAESKVDLSLIGGDTMDLILLCLVNECTEAFGSVDKEGWILA